MEYIKISAQLSIQAHNAGLFISRGQGTHGERTIDTCELIFVRQGVLSMYENGEAFILTAGQTLLLLPDRRHGGAIPYSDDLRFYWVHFDVVDGRPETPTDIPKTARLSRPDHMTTLFRMFIENQESDQKSVDSANLLLMLMLIEVAQFGNTQDTAITASKLRLVDRANSFIELNSDVAVSTSSIARALDVNSDYLGRVFHAVKGRTITDTIHLRRVKNAKTMLMESDDPIDRISAICGFESPHYFRRIFQRLEGMPPGKYRLLYCRIHANTE